MLRGQPGDRNAGARSRSAGYGSPDRSLPRRASEPTASSARIGRASGARPTRNRCAGPRHGRRVARGGECPRDRCRRRDPPRREHVAPPPAGARRRRRDPRLLPRPFRSEPLHALPRLPLARPRRRRAGARVGLGGARGASRVDRRGRHRAGRRARELRAPARPLPRRGGVRGRGHPPAPRGRHASRRAARRARRPSRDRALRRARPAREPADARRLRGARVRADPRAFRRRGRGHVPDPAHGAVRGARRRARPRRGDGVAAAVLRAAERGRDRCFAAPRDDRRRALPEHPRRRLRRRGLSREPRRGLGCRGPRLSVGRRDPRSGRPGRHLRPGGRRDRGGGAGARPRCHGPSS